MKNLILPLAMIFALFFVAACEDREEEGGVRTTVYDKAEQESTAPPEGEPVLLPPQREQYIDTMEGVTEEFQEKMQELQARLEGLTEAARTEFAPEIEAMREDLKLLRSKVARLKEAGDQGWEELSAEADASLEELKDEYRQLLSRIDKAGQ